MSKKYQINLNVRALRAGEYTAGANMYIIGGSSKELERIASLFIYAKSKRSAAIKAIEILLNKVPESSHVTFYGRQIGQSVRYSLTHKTRQTIEDKSLYLSIVHNELEEELPVLYELAEEAAEHRKSLIELI